MKLVANKSQPNKSNSNNPATNSNVNGVVGNSNKNNADVTSQKIDQKTDQKTANKAVNNSDNNKNTTTTTTTTTNAQSINNATTNPPPNNKPINSNITTNQNTNKSPYNNPPAVKLRAEIIPQKIPNKNNKNNKLNKQSSSQSSSSDDSSYDSEVEDFANQFYDSAVKIADKSLREQKKDNQEEQGGLENSGKQGQGGDGKGGKENDKTKKPLTQWDHISSRLKELKHNFNDLDMDALLFKKKDENKLKQIAEFLAQKHKEKKQFMRKLKKIKHSQKQRKKIEQEIQKKQQADAHTNRLKEIRKLSQQIKDKIQKKKQQQQTKLQDIEAFYQQFHKKYNRHKKLYKLMQLSDKKRRNKQIEQENQYLKERRNVVSQIISKEDIQEFKKRREEFLRDIQKVKQLEKDQKLIEIHEQNKMLREKIYIGRKYVEMQEETEKREKIKDLPKEKLVKVKKYNEFIKENFMPVSKKDDENGEDHQENDREQEVEEQPIVEIDGKMYKRVKKDRYLKGQKIGEMVVNIPIPKSEKQTRMVGNSYLQQLKLLPKKRHSTSLDLTRISQQDSKQKPSKPSVSLTSRISIPHLPRKKPGKINLSTNASRHEIQNLINSLKAKDEVIFRQQHYLKAVNRGGEGRTGKEELDEDLLDNIEKKINLLGRL